MADRIVDGRLVYVQPIGETPKYFDEESTEVYGVGRFLLAGSEVYRLVRAAIPPSHKRAAPP